MKLIIEGWPLSGKTTRLIDEYKGIVRNNTRTDDILVLVMNGNQLKRWRSALELPVSGSLQVFTYWGFLQKELNRYWNWVITHLGDGEESIRPLFLNVESAHYLMTLLVEEKRSAGGFNSIVASSSQIAIQVLNNLNQAAINEISIEETVCRLTDTCKGDRNKAQAFDDTLSIAKKFREHCLKYRCVDYSLLVDIYNKHLLPKEEYKSLLKNRYKNLIVDNLEEAIPVQIKLIDMLLGHIDNAYMAFDPTGGHTRSFGAAPVLVKEMLYPICKVEKTDQLFGCNCEAVDFADVISRNIRNMERNKISSAVINPDGISTEFRADMISKLGEAVIKLLEDGHTPKSIAVISPGVDKVLELSLTEQLKAAGYSVQNIAKRKHLSDESYAQIMVSIASLVESETGWICNRMSLARCFSTVLGLDPIRSSLLANHCFRGGTPELPDLDETGLRPRIGFSKGKEYDEFKTKLEKIAGDEHEPDNLFQRIFSEILAPVVKEKDDIVTSRQIIDSAIKFYKSYQALPIFQKQPFVQRFLDLITKGTVAAEAFRQEEIRDDAVILATPFALFRNSLSIEHQFWIDCSDHRWFTKEYKELCNPLIMSGTWDGTWDDDIALEHRRDRAATTLVGLLYRSSGSVTVIESEYSSLGYPQDSALPGIIYDSLVIHE